MDGLLRIGEFARLGHVSVKALRFYEEQGLLSPAHVDHKTGYRYYTLEQTNSLASITNLRVAGFSIAEISELLNAGSSHNDLEAAMEFKRRSLLDEQATIETKLKIIDALMKSLDASEQSPVSAPKLTTMASQLVHTIERTVPKLGAPVTEMFETAEAAVARHGARAPSSPFLIFHKLRQGDGGLDLEACIPLSFNPNTDLPVKKTPESKLACSIVYSGDYAQTETLHLNIVSWMKTAGVRAAGPLREIYHRFGAEQEDYRLPTQMLAKSRAAFLTELQIAIEP